jgi:allene oxide cyclase
MKNAFLILAVLLIGALIAGTVSSQTPETMTIQVVERATTDVTTDLGEEGDSVGDILTFANEVYDEVNENQVGTDNGYCVRTEVGVAYKCAWTLTLEDGQIMVDGPFNDTGDSVLAITGGTGAYMGARGQMTLKFRDDAGTEFDFIYEIMQ